MAKPPTFIGVLTEVPAPTWWKANRHKVLAIGGLLIGLYLGTHQDGTQPSRPGDTTPSPSSTHTTPHAQPETGTTSHGRITIRLFRSER
ncbi:hypothetical protein ACIBL8_41245 [Streptomyces sp. NPDC050523]|uniref:hypothetical protein n=1 Tax=Streptomyces sp. NPDC050523 TaxID=3365622 RepID=UPI00378D1D20